MMGFFMFYSYVVSFKLTFYHQNIINTQHQKLKNPP